MFGQLILSLTKYFLPVTQISFQKIINSDEVSLGISRICNNYFKMFDFVVINGKLIRCQWGMCLSFMKYWNMNRAYSSCFLGVINATNGLSYICEIFIGKDIAKNYVKLDG